MNKKIWLVAGIAGMLLGNPAADAKAAISVQINTGSNPSFVINSAPNFIYLRSQGFSVSIGNPYDMVYYGDFYYIYYNSHWYRSSSYHGPWIIILNNRLPYQIRRHRWEDIRRYRDIEYRRSDRNDNQYQRNDDNRRKILDQRNEANSRRVQDQQNKAVETRRVQQQNKAVEIRRVQPKNKAHNIKRVQEQPKKGTDNQRTQEEQGKGVINNDRQGKGVNSNDRPAKGDNSNDRQNNGGKRN